jgi:Na+-transporting NADH:ubiquinone oxidoreductase subunit C
VKKSLFSVAYMFLITLFFTSLVSGVKQCNDARIEQNQQVKLQRIIVRVLYSGQKGARTDEALIRMFQTQVKQIRVKDKTVYVGYEPDGKTLRGYAFPVGGQGFWGSIHGMVAVDPEGSKITGIAFYKHSETPGLGARITEAWFTDQFIGVRLLPLKEGKQIFYLKPEGTKSAPNELDAVTGATGTSRAVELFLNGELDYFLKNIWKSIEAGQGPRTG